MLVTMNRHALNSFVHSSDKHYFFLLSNSSFKLTPRLTLYVDNQPKSAGLYEKLAGIRSNLQKSAIKTHFSHVSIYLFLLDRTGTWTLAYPAGKCDIIPT